MANPSTPNGLGFIPVPSPGTPVQFTAAKTPSKVIRIIPLKTTGAANTGVVYIGKVGLVKGTGVGVYAALRPGDQGITINVGDLLNSDYYDLSNWYVDADTAADAILVGYQN
jgi:hypothetical protein